MNEVLDVCCGSRMFWFESEDGRAIFMDNRSESHVLKDRSSRGGHRHLTVRPQMIGDFTALPFADETFFLVVFDPPHLARAGQNGWQAKKYGKLQQGWQETIHLRRWKWLSS